MIRIFISSVQSEFSKERKMLYDYISKDDMLSKFFLPFIFEKHPAKGDTVKKVYLDEVSKSDIYLGLFGKDYGFEDEEGISPTEREYDQAAKLKKTRLIFIKDVNEEHRNTKEKKLIVKSEKSVVRKKFSSAMELKASVYSALVRYLEDNGQIRTGPFDATFHPEATLDDLDPEKITNFIRKARYERRFPLPIETPPEILLAHLNLLKNDRLTNAAILLFGKQPQRFFLSSEVKCAQFYGYTVEKPIPAHQVYKGTVFEMADQAVDFVLSRIDLWVGTRAETNAVPTRYEIPREAILEAIVNAVVHRDYTSNASVQVMLFRDRLEV
ncbi:TPA: transcriptional regulator, partial [Candidatus Delongbacteria bacterium]|nr:transcriptional regulator [Candidatus Delongbacteria bacterium]